MSNLPTSGDNGRDDAEKILATVRDKGHAWWPKVDIANQTHVWTCTCNEIVYQPFGAPVPCELISHPQEHGQMRGERS